MASASPSSSTTPHQHHPPPHQHTYNELEEFNEDFVPRSTATARQNRPGSMDAQADERVQIRRMSLREFSGLDSMDEHAAQQGQQQNSSNGSNNGHHQQQHGGTILSPHLHPWKGAQFPAFGSLIEKFSTARRRSSSSSTAKGGTDGAGASAADKQQQQQQSNAVAPYNSFDRALDGINQAIRDSTGGGDDQKVLEEQSRLERARRDSVQMDGHGTGGSWGHTLQRLTNIRNHLNSTLRAVPNVSPRKAEALEHEKLMLLSECRLLVAACKEMVRSANPPAVNDSSHSVSSSASTGDCLSQVQAAVDSAERMNESVEVLIRKSSSIFQAQQLTTNADQLLKVLAETAKEVEKCCGQQQKQQKSGGDSSGSEQAKQLIRCSTTLAANLIQFTELIRSMA